MKSPNVICAPRIMPKGTLIKNECSEQMTMTYVNIEAQSTELTMNIFATEWSNPSATKAEIGNQTATIFPAREAHPEAM